MPTNDRGSKCTHRYNTVVIVAIVIVRVVRVPVFGIMMIFTVGSPRGWRHSICAESISHTC